MTWSFIDQYSGDRYVNLNGMSFDMEQLKVDEHYITVSTNNPDVNLTDINLYTLDKECVECPYLFVDKSLSFISDTNHVFRLATDYKDYYPVDDVNSVVCDLDGEFGEFGFYNIKVNNLSSCTVEVLREPANIYAPILTVLLIHFAVFGSTYILQNLWQKLKRKTLDESNDENQDISVTKQKERVMSIDAVRGISIVIMIFANFGNGGYRFVHHAVWNGLHVADLVFPWFMWIMGACIPISLTSSFKKNIPNKELLLVILKRSVKLFLLGIFLNSGCDVYYIRIFGVLQRFGLCYFIVTSICILTIDRDLSRKNEEGLLRHFEDILKVWKGWIICCVTLLVHTVLIFVVAAPGCPRGYMGPGGLHLNRSYEHCVGGATGYIDRMILGNHSYQNPTIYKVFEAKPFDPEGLVGCLSTIFHVMLGVQAGVTLLVYKEHFQRIIRWLVWCLVLGTLGGALCGFSKENGLIPVNKNLWSTSFVFVTCSFAFFLLTVCYVLIDVKKWWSGKTLIFAGMNAILLYVGTKRKHISEYGRTSKMASDCTRRSSRANLTISMPCAPSITRCHVALLCPNPCHHYVGLYKPAVYLRHNIFSHNVH